MTKYFIVTHTFRKFLDLKVLQEDEDVIDYYIVDSTDMNSAVEEFLKTHAPTKMYITELDNMYKPPLCNGKLPY